jgi:hypothetical protein
MKRSLQGSLVSSIFIFSIAVNAQSINDRTGRIPFEKPGQIPGNHITVQPQKTEWTAYGYEVNSMYSFSVPVPEGTPFSWLAFWWNPYSYFASSMTIGPDGQYYITDVGVPPLLYQFDPLTGIINYNGVITGMGEDQPNGIAYNHYNGKYYIVSGTMLYLFDICSLTAEPVGPLNTAGGMIDLCFREGVCYAYDIFDDNAYTIDLTTGNAALLGTIGFNAEYGQGMSYDEYSGTIYLSAFNYQTFSAQLRTMDPATGMTTLVTDWGYAQIAPFAVENYFIGYPVSPATNPDPPPGTDNINIEGVTLNWTNNGWGTNESEVWFNYSGTPLKLYDGPVISSWPTGALPYQTVCEWRINSKYADCCSLGPLWSFTTETVPASGFYDSFYNLDNWTEIGPNGTENWHIVWVQYTGGAYPPELVCNQDPFFNGLSRLISCPVSTVPGEYVQIHFRQFLECADSATISGIAVTYDDGQTYTILQSNENIPCGPHKELFYTAFLPEAIPFRLILFINGISSNISWLIDDLYAYNCPDCPPPNAPGSLSAQIIYDPGPLVHLSWEDISWNELGFDIFRKAGNPNDPGEYILVGNAPQNTTGFNDNSVSPESTYTYRVFSSNYNGSSGSGTATITLPIPVELISFTGESDGRTVTLHWQTATETNNMGFEIPPEAKYLLKAAVRISASGRKSVIPRVPEQQQNL